MLYEVVWGHEQSDLGTVVILVVHHILLSPVHMWFICTHLLPSLFTLNTSSSMSMQPSKMQTCAKNANQHPGYLQRKPHQLTATDPVTQKAHAELAKVAKTAKQVAKLMGAAHVSKFKMDEMEREDMLDVTPCPATGDQAEVQAYDPSSGGFIIDTDIDTDELNPDKGTYKPSTTEDDSTDDISIVPTLPPQKMTYAEAASPRGKTRAAPVARAMKAVPLRKMNQSEEGSTTESDSPLLFPVTQAMMSAQLTKHSILASKVKAHQSNSDMESDTLPPSPTASLNPKTPVPQKKTKQKKLSPMGDMTGPESPPHEIEPHSPVFQVLCGLVCP